MNVRELRIGNYINFALLNIVKVEKINPKTLCVKASDSLSGKDEFHDMISFQGDNASGNSRIGAFLPITLTEEMLLKCGFNIDNSKGFCNSDDTTYTVYYLKGFDVAIVDDCFYLWNECEDAYYNTYSTKIETLHKLQNIYFFLENKELEINL